MPKRRARKPSIASEMPATAKSTKAASHCPQPIMAMTTGTRMRRAIVMRLGRVMMAGRDGDALNLGSDAALCEPPGHGALASGLAQRRPASYCPDLKSACARPGVGQMQKPPKNGLTYAQSGVDIDAGNAMVEAIKPLVRATKRP